MKPLLVLDSNVVLDWVVFDDPSARELGLCIESGDVGLATSAACREELRLVLAYATLKLDSSAQAAALARYARYAIPFEDASDEPAVLPRCSDPDDQKFLALAWHARADWLVTRDKALLAMRRRFARLGRFGIVAPSALVPGMAWTPIRP